MGQKEVILKSILTKEFEEDEHSKPFPKALLNSDFAENIYAVYSQLNGQLDEPPTRFGSWDVPLRDFIVELDEERHFNRYRLLTLNSDFYKDNTVPFSLEKYKAFCSQFENQCLKAAAWGKNWKNASTEKQFGISEEKGVLEGNGSSRWKQRAFYDFLKDIASKIMDVPVVRLSIYEEINGNRIDSLIRNQEGNRLNEAIRERLKGL